MDVERALGTIAWAAGAMGCPEEERLGSLSSDAEAADRGVLIGSTDVKEKLSRVLAENDDRPELVDLLHLMSAFLFDLARKFDYIYLATAQFSDGADPDLAARIRAHNEMLSCSDAGGVVNIEHKTAQADLILRRLDALLNDYDEKLRVFTETRVDYPSIKNNETGKVKPRPCD